MNVGAFVDVAQKQVSGFVRGEMDAGKYGVVVADVEGVELQKEWTVGEGDLGGRWPAWAASTISVSAGLGFQRESRGEPDFNPRPYVNVDVRPSERNAKGAMVSLSLRQRPARRLPPRAHPRQAPQRGVPDHHHGAQNARGG